MWVDGGLGLCLAPPMWSPRSLLLARGVQAAFPRDPGVSALILGCLLSLGDFPVLSLCWHSSGDSLALLSKDHFCLCFLDTEEGVHTALGQRDSHA